MMRLRRSWRSAVVALGVVGAFSILRAQQPAAQSPGESASAEQPIARTARRAEVAVGDVFRHPLAQAIERAQQAAARAAQLGDYTYVLVKRELIDGKLNDHDAVLMKIRARPFSVYAHTLGPVQPKGQEAIYVEGRNDGKAWAHTTGFRHKLLGCMSLLPNGPEMMTGNRYPLTDAGMVTMLSNVLDGYRRAAAHPDADVQVIPGAKVDGRSSTCVQVSHSAPRPEFRYALTRIFYDDELGLPIRWEAYEWPRQPGGQLPLAEEYTFRNLRVNVGLGERDFDIENDAYGFK